MRAAAQGGGKGRLDSYPLTILPKPKPFGPKQVHAIAGVHAKTSDDC